MGRSRSTRRFGAGLGLFALMLQLALSFGHIHADDLVPRSAADLAGAVVLNQAKPGLAHDEQAPGPAHDDCPICAVMHLAGTIVVPSPPTLVLPTARAAAPPPSLTAPFVLAARRSPFRTRAPPQA
jgi:Protein of unknown function (DUF2946)